MVLSNHHYDHGSGITKFLELDSKAKVYLAESPQADCHANVLGLLAKYISLDDSTKKGNPDRLITISEPVKIVPDVFIFPKIVNHRLG